MPRRASGTYHGGFPGASSDAVGGVITFTATDTLRIGDGQVVEYRPTPRACSSSSNWAFGKRPAERDPPARRADDFRPAGLPAGSPGWEDAPAGPDVIRGRDCPAGGTCSTHFDGTDLAPLWRRRVDADPVCGSGGGWLQVDLLGGRFLPTGGADGGEQGQEGGHGGDANADPEGQDGAVGLGESY